jgi:predicted PurR-regulated permease PerM
MGAKKSGVSALTILLGFFSGPVIFGAKGLLLGPILFVITETVIVEYMLYRVSEKEGLENSVSEA